MSVSVFEQQLLNWAAQRGLADQVQMGPRTRDKTACWITLSDDQRYAMLTVYSSGEVDRQVAQDGGRLTELPAQQLRHPADLDPLLNSLL